MFILALSFASFSKALAGTYMKTSITQIERRFELSSTHIGLIDSSFEMGTTTFNSGMFFLIMIFHTGQINLFSVVFILFYLVDFIGVRQPAVPGGGQPFWGQTASTQTYFGGLFPHGSWIFPHGPDTLLHGEVHINKS